MPLARLTAVALLAAVLLSGLLAQSPVFAATSSGPKTCPTGKTRVILKRRAVCLLLPAIKRPNSTTPLSLLSGYTLARKSALEIEAAFIRRRSDRPSAFAKKSFGRKADKRTQAFIKKRTNDFMSAPTGIFQPPKPKKQRLAQAAAAFPVGYTQALAGGGVVTVLPGNKASFADSASDGDTTVTTTAVKDLPSDEPGPDETAGWNAGILELTTDTVVKNKAGGPRERMIYGAKATAPKCPSVSGGVSGKGDAVSKLLINMRPAHGSLHGANVEAKATFAYSAQIGDDGEPVSKDIQVEAKFDSTTAAADGGTHLKLRQSATIHIAADGATTLGGSDAQIDDVRIPDTTDYYTGKGAKDVRNLAKSTLGTWNLLILSITSSVDEQLRLVHKHWNTPEDCVQSVLDPAQLDGVHVGDSGHFSAALRTALGVPVPNVTFTPHFVKGNISENGLTTGSGGEPIHFDWTSEQCPGDGSETAGVLLESTSRAGKSRKRWVATCENEKVKVPFFTLHATVKTTYHLAAGDFVVEDFAVDGVVSERSQSDPSTSAGVGIVDGDWAVIDVESGHETESATLIANYSTDGSQLIVGWIPDGDFAYPWSGLQIVDPANGTTQSTFDRGDESDTVTTVTISDLHPSQ